MGPLDQLITDLLGAAANGRVLWPDVGVFGLHTRKRMPGFPGYTRLQFWPSEHLYRRLNNGDSLPAYESASPLATEPVFAARIAATISEELVKRGEVSVPGLGMFGVEKRKTTEDDQYTAVFRSSPDLLRRLNPADRDYEAALATEWPGGPPTQPPSMESN